MPNVRLNSNKKILVTGGAGYIGVVTVEELLKKGYQVRVVDTCYWGKESLNHLRHKIEIINQDIREVKEEVLQGIWAVIHLAAIATDQMAEADPQAAIEINTQATARLAKLAKKKGIKRFIFSSSASIYHQHSLKKERFNRKKQTPGVCTEESWVSPEAIYSLSKYRAEQKLLELADADFWPVIFRQGTVYGFSPRMRYDLVVNSMVKSALSSNKIEVYCGGKQWRPLVSVRDVARVYICSLLAPASQVGGQIFNLVYRNYQVIELARSIRNSLIKLIGVRPRLTIDDSSGKDRSYCIAGNKIKRILGWQPSISIEESVEEMISKIKKVKLYTDKVSIR